MIIKETNTQVFFYNFYTLAKFKKFLSVVVSFLILFFWFFFKLFLQFTFFVCGACFSFVIKLFHLQNGTEDGKSRCRIKSIAICRIPCFCLANSYSLKYCCMRNCKNWVLTSGLPTNFDQVSKQDFPQFSNIISLIFYLYFKELEKS